MMDSFRQEIKTLLDDLLLGMPGVKAGKMFGFPAYKANGKTFLFVIGHGLTIKLPQARVDALMTAQPDIMRPFSPVETMKAWREWVLIEHDDLANYEAEIDLLEESALYVAS